MTGMEIVEVLGNVGEFVGSIAVFATLLYLAMQVRDSKKAAMFAAVQANRAERISNFISQRDSPYLPSILNKVASGEALSAEESTRLFAHDGASWAQLYAEWVQRELGFMGEFATREGIANATVFGSPSAREWWALAGRHVYPERFVAKIDAAIVEFDGSSEVDQYGPALRMMAGR